MKTVLLSLALLVGVTSVARAEEDLKTVTAERDMLKSALRHKVEELDQLRASTKELEQAVAELQKQLAEIQEQLAAKNKQIADLKVKAGLAEPEPEDGPKITKLADRKYQVGPVTVATSTPILEHVELIEGQGATRTDGRYLRITVELVNLDEGLKLDCITWGAQPLQNTGTHATLTDDLGNTYKSILFGSGTSVNLTYGVTLYPGKSVRQMLVFELPVEKAAKLTLTLPLENVGMDGQITFDYAIEKVRRGE